MARKKKNTSKLNIAIKYRIFPTPEQEVFFAKTFGCCRKIWNLRLADRMEHYSRTKETIYPQPAQYKEKFPFLQEPDSMALCNVQLNQEQAFRMFYDKKSGFPKFKAKHRAKRSYTTSNLNGNVRVYREGYIRLPKLPKFEVPGIKEKNIVRAELYRMPDEDWTVKSVTVSQDSDGRYYASVLFEHDSAVQAVPVSDNAIGLDFKVDGLYVDSEGGTQANHKYYRKSLKKLAKAQRRLSRRTGARKGEQKSHNYLKQLGKLKKLHRKIANRRRDHLHKISDGITNCYDVICVEDLTMQELLADRTEPCAGKRHNINRAYYDNGWGYFTKFLEYKSARRGKHFVKVAKDFQSSRKCSCCGQIKPMPLGIRVYDCGCGLHMDRDLNAAINIKNEGLRMLRS